MKRKQKKFRIMGKVWTVKIGRPPEKEKLDGQCRYDERIIYLHPDALASDGIDIVTHEVLHACVPCLDEDTVKEVGIQVSQVCGWVGKVTGGKLTHGYSGRA